MSNQLMLGSRSRRITWVIKVSKFCNMRCAYCYEWDDLAKRDKMSFDTWRGLFKAIKDYHVIQSKRNSNTFSTIILHGGEPLTLPLDYLEKVLNLGFEMLNDNNVLSNISIGIQSNLYRLTERMIEFIRRNKIEVGVSFDFIPGVRLTTTGKETEAVVLKNIDRLTKEGIKIGAITVLAKHTYEHVCWIYDFYANRKIPWRILPLFDGPNTRDVDKFSVSYDKLIGSLETLFIHWFESGIAIPVAPFMEHFENTLRKMTGIHGRLYNRRIDGDGVFVVNHNGMLFRILDGYDPSLAMGNVQDQTIEEIFDSPQYLASLIRDEEHFDKYCTNCTYEGACNGWPIFASRQNGEFNGRCPLSYRIHQFMEKFLIANGYDEVRLKEMLLLILSNKVSSFSKTNEFVSI